MTAARSLLLLLLLLLVVSCIRHASDQTLH